MTRKQAAYGSWVSPLDVSTVFEQPSLPLYPHQHEGMLYWLEMRPQEKGRVVLIQQDSSGKEHCLTPADFNIRSRVHEYGGRSFVIGHGEAFFSNESDQRVYRQRLESGAEPRPITAQDGAGEHRSMFIDLQITPDENWLVAVGEQAPGAGENINQLVAISLKQGIEAQAYQELASGCDFYANPVISPDGRQMGWIQWNHPDMSWDQSELMVADLIFGGDEIKLDKVRQIAGGEGSSVCQLHFGLDGVLYFAMDRDAPNQSPENFWNLYAWHDNEITQISQELYEFGEPHWIFGEARLVQVDHRLLAVRSDDRGQSLIWVDTQSTDTQVLTGEGNSFTHLSTVVNDADQVEAVWFVRQGSATPGELCRLDTLGQELTVAKSWPLPLTPANISRPELISYPTRDGTNAFAWFYAPCNEGYEPLQDERPPLLVLVHGGPTSRARPSFDAAKQFWTTQGFAILDVDHRGSTGYGRAYRKALNGRWGEIDASDIADAVAYALGQAWVDPNRVVIRGGSAGGYAVLRMLTEYPDLFCAGASYYGIGDLASLAQTTHKFEARYLDGLLGASYGASDTRDSDNPYYARSPIHFMDRLNCPMILFQGLEDRVVPPEQARDVVAMLKKKNIDHEYVEYPGEGHGFRNSDTRIDALTREAAFYRRVFGLQADQS